MMVLKFLNLPAFQAFIKKTKKLHAEGFERGLTLGALAIQAEAVRQTPIDLGPLRGSYAGSPRKTGTGFGASVEISCGTYYAIYVHENMTARHASGTNAKFLEKPAREMAPKVQQLVIQEARKGV
jgi:hypothetical protein